MNPQAEADRLRTLIARPYVGAWLDEVLLEAAHQRDRWGAQHDARKSDADWLWLVAHLTTKAMLYSMAGDRCKARHHTVSAGAALCHWAAQISGHEPVQLALGSEKLLELKE